MIYVGNVFTNLSDVFSMAVGQILYIAFRKTPGERLGFMSYFPFN